MLVKELKALWTHVINQMNTFHGFKVRLYWDFYIAFGGLRTTVVAQIHETSLLWLLH